MTFFFNPDEFTNKKTTSKSFIAEPCKLCNLYKKVHSPKMEPFGGNKKNIFILGEAPGEDEDEEGIGFVGRSGRLLNRNLKNNDVNFDEDCIRSNVLQCRPPDNKFLPDKVQYCYERLELQIKKYKPKLIMCFGFESIKRILQTNLMPTTLECIHGLVFPSVKYNCWVSCHYHPAFILRVPDYENMFNRDIIKVLSYLKKDLPKTLLDSGENIVIENKEDIIDFLNSISNIKFAVAFDFETNELSPFYEHSELLSVSFSLDEEIGYTIPLKPVDEDVWNVFAGFLKSTTPKICHSGKFEEIWSHQLLFQPMCNLYWDTQLTAHLLNEHPDTKSLAFQTFLSTGEEYKEMVDRKRMAEMKKETVYKYNSLDSRYTFFIYKNQMKEIVKEHLENPRKFLLKGDRALAQLELNGVKIDKEAFFDYRDNRIEKIYKESIQNIKGTEVANEFRRKKGYEIDINKSDDLKYVFFKIYDVKPLTLTAKKKEPQLNDDFFQFYKDDAEIGEFCSNIIDYKTVYKMKTTYIKAIEKYVDNSWILHPVYNLWSTLTYRSSCDSPNLQNVPKRDESQAEFRKIFVPRFDYLLDADHKGSEVVIQAILANDKVLIDQLKNGLDPHRYWASRLYKLPEKDISKKQRYNTKNGFVFPLLYGSYHVTIARSLGLEESHVKECEDEFFTTYNGIKNYQNEKVEEYERLGYITTPLGFRRHEPLSRNQIVNYPIQSVSFHYLLDTLSSLILVILKEYNFKSMPVLQVHDDILSDMVENEIEYYYEILQELTQNKPQFKFVKDLSITVEYSKGRNLLEMEKLYA